MREEEEEERMGAPVVHMEGGVSSFFLLSVLLSLSASLPFPSPIFLSFSWSVLRSPHKKCVLPVLPPLFPSSLLPIPHMKCYFGRYPVA